MDLKLIDFFRCPPVIVFDALVAKRWNFSTLLYYKSGALSFCISFLGISFSTFLFLCQKEWLVEFYRFIIGVLLLIFSFLLQSTLVANFNSTQISFPDFITQSSYLPSAGLHLQNVQFTWLEKILLCVVIQLSIYTLFICRYVYGKNMTKKWVIYGYICSLASAFAVMFTKADFITVSCIYITLLPQFLQLYTTMGRFCNSCTQYCTLMWRSFNMDLHENGLLAILEALWNKLRVPQVLRLFFLFRFVLISSLLYFRYPIEHDIDKEYHPEGMYYYIMSIGRSGLDTLGTHTFITTNNRSTPVFLSYMFKNVTFPVQVGGITTGTSVMDHLQQGNASLDSFQSLVVKLTDSLVSIFSISSVMYVPLYYFGVVIHMVVGGMDAAHAASLSIVSATLFCLLSIQTGLSGLPPQKRLIRLARNMWLLFAAILHFIHDLVNPVLLQISTQVNIPIKKHIRPLLVLWVLFGIPILLCWWITTAEPISTWMVAVVAFCVELVFKVISTFMLYLVFGVDARVDHRPWPHMDDYVFIIQSTAHIIEFICGCIMFVNGAYVFWFESGNLLRALMMTMHAYINIYKAACDGWKTFNNRRTVNKRISRLVLATDEVLSSQYNDDVCSICYQEFTDEFGEARMTPCKHLFHSSCLRRWLFIRENCPMCHQNV